MTVGKQTNPEWRIEMLERRVFRLTVAGGLLVMALLVISIHSGVQSVRAAGSEQILHPKGLIIYDAQGHSRILIGAPVPGVPDRLRQESPTTSVIFLDEKGHDRSQSGRRFPTAPAFIALVQRTV